MTRPVIGLTPQYDKDDIRFATPVRYITALEYVGALPVVLPVLKKDDEIEKCAEFCDGIMFTGGDDVDPVLFGEKKDEKCGFISRARDDFEIALLKAAMERQKPVFGVCRGIQVMNVALGGSLCQHGDGHMSVSHKVQIKAGSLAEKLTGVTDLITNSYHHQYVTKPGKGVEITAYSSDGVAEAIEFPGYPFFFATQWHPEMTSPDCYGRTLIGNERLDDFSLSILKAFADACSVVAR